MTTATKRMVVLPFATALLSIAGMGGNTAHDSGGDMENAGDKIQEDTK